jgi:tetratricopeptide (TPR) repeat protein
MLFFYPAELTFRNEFKGKGKSKAKRKVLRLRLRMTGVSEHSDREHLMMRIVNHHRALLWPVLSLTLALPAISQTEPGQAPSQQQKPPAAPAPAPAQPAQPPAAAPTHKPPPVAKTQEEFAAYQAAVSISDIAAAEKAADDFAAKFPQSDLRGLLYSNLMRRYQQANDSEKTLEIARKVLTYEPNDPLALVMAATDLAERTRESDLDRDERYDESVKDAQKALETVNTDLVAPNNITSEQLDSYKKMVMSMAHSDLGIVALNRQDNAGAKQHFEQSIALSPPGEVDPLSYLRLAVAEDRLKQYSEALASANKAVSIAPPNSPVGVLAKHEVDRLGQLTGTSATTPAPAAPSTNAPPK